MRKYPPMHIKRSDTVPSFASPHGELVFELIGERMGAVNSHSVAQIVLPYGKASRKHYHPEAEESYYVLAGRGRVVLDGEEQKVMAGDTVWIPPGVVHQIFNTGHQQENLIFLAVCIPAWTPDNSVFLD
ncbi:MAG: cupin domain-containing protein [Chloroflexota bacterium]